MSCLGMFGLCLALSSTNKALLEGIVSLNPKANCELNEVEKSKSFSEGVALVEGHSGCPCSHQVAGKVECLVFASF